MIEKVRINQQIRALELRVVDEKEGNLGVLPTAEALEKAKERGLDLIEISPNAVPPVAKIMDYGRFQYIAQKKEKEARAKSHITETKTIQIKIGTSERDLDLKAKKSSEWLRDGHRVKLNLFLPGRTKYMEQKFLKERMDRILRLISEEYKVAEAPQKSLKGLTIMIERAGKKKEEVKHQSLVTSTIPT
ncbi:MAG: translation initiation factor IF-3 [bacterium]|nr:translation initiation factor IF-3 [bacterium]